MVNGVSAGYANVAKVLVPAKLFRLLLVVSVTIFSVSEPLSNASHC